MTCDQAQLWLLEAELPDSPDPAVQAHLLRCADCRAVQARLLRLERALRARCGPVGRIELPVLTEWIAGLEQRPN